MTQARYVDAALPTIIRWPLGALRCFQHFTRPHAHLQVSWYDVYVKVRSYGVIQHYHVHKQRQICLQSITAEATEATFVLHRTAKTDQLKLIDALECGNGRVPIKWTRTDIVQPFESDLLYDELSTFVVQYDPGQVS